MEIGASFANPASATAERNGCSRETFCFSRSTSEILTTCVITLRSLDQFLLSASSRSSLTLSDARFEGRACVSPAVPALLFGLFFRFEILALWRAKVVHGSLSR